MNNLFCKKNVYLINIDNRKDRLKSSTSLLNSLDIPYNRFSAIVPDMNKIKNNITWNKSYQGINPKKCKKWKNYLKGSLGCKMSHYNVIKLAKEADLPYAIVFEDDIVTSYDKDYINTIFKDIYNFISKNNTWDIIYLGGTVIGKTYSIIDNISKVQSVLKTTGYILNNKAYDIVMDSFIKNNIECDNILLSLSNKNLIETYYNNLFQQLNNSTNICN